MKDSNVYIIAEAGVNHNGSLSLAKKLVDAAAQAGADAVKFQSFRSESLVSASAPKARYQKAATGRGGSQLEMLRALELDERSHHAIQKHCRMRSIQFLSTPFDEESLAMLVDRMHVPVIKIPSGEITNGPFLLAAARTGKPVMLSTGMSTLDEVRSALEVLAFGYARRSDRPSAAILRKAYRSASGQNMLRKNVTLLHCTTEYPARSKDVNLRAMETMRKAFDLPVGLSDHTPGIAVSVAAAALGAAVIEKHFTLDRSLPGPDHKASLTPEELGSLVSSIRTVEHALGNGRKAPMPGEMENRAVARRSLVALRNIRRGELLTEENMGCKRPGSGISPMRYWTVAGRMAARHYAKDELIRQ